MRVTVTVLPVSLSLLHIPRSRLAQLSHHIIRQILQPNPVFLSITSNEIELSIFAESQSLQEFEHIAKRDRHKYHSRSPFRQSPPHDFEPIDISCETWRVLQIDSHNTSGARVNELSAPLAAAGISILYQSSYMSDFIFVNESRLQKVIQLFSKAGFDLYSNQSSFTAFTEASRTFDINSDQSGAVFTRSRGRTESSNALGITLSPDALDQQSGRTSPQASDSPISAEVSMLSPDLACVGLSDEFGVDHWGLKLVKLVAFPDLISSPSKTRSPDFVPSHYPRAQSPLLEKLDLSEVFLSSTPGFSPTSPLSYDEDDGYFSHSPKTSAKPPLPRMASRSYTDLPNTIPVAPSKHRKPKLSPLAPVGTPSTSSGSTSGSPKQADSFVPFFSFTRTAEGSSLTTDVHLLASLFPPHERHMVICGAELAAVDEAVDGNELDDVHESTLKCLQIDLRQFGLDKYGIVNRYSRMLAFHGINHMYSSTFKTANLLVEKRHANRAHHILSAF
ncbi:hypothetical protein M378DRAFT_183814 [Amanita muscaria Koide BX008]|uniref:CASTOR ACT domain-containing protein n=1 Tax=Amanita muscaria (strain Koide BX008) TaxID=946122 RepID=A0A0C2T313_AMAMK|nr:hypothetical protein M378DRAFT_183814 [Amanita muscaria Koide BX008]